MVEGVQWLEACMYIFVYFVKLARSGFAMISPE